MGPKTDPEGSWLWHAGYLSGVASVALGPLPSCSSPLGPQKCRSLACFFSKGASAVDWFTYWVKRPCLVSRVRPAQGKGRAGPAQRCCYLSMNDTCYWHTDPYPCVFAPLRDTGTLGIRQRRRRNKVQPTQASFQQRRADRLVGRIDKQSRPRCLHCVQLPASRPDQTRLDRTARLVTSCSVPVTPHSTCSQYLLVLRLPQPCVRAERAGFRPPLVPQNSKPKLKHPKETNACLASGSCAARAPLFCLWFHIPLFPCPRPFLFTGDLITCASPFLVFFDFGTPRPTTSCYSHPHAH